MRQSLMMLLTLIVKPCHLWPPTVPEAIVKDDRPGALLCQDLGRPAVPLQGDQWGRSPIPRSCGAPLLCVHE